MQQPSQDSILLEGMAFYAYHGVNPEERTLGQRFLVDVQVYLNLAKAGASDNLADTVNYSALYQVTQSIVEGQAYNLLEAVAETLAQQVLASFPVLAVRVRLRKPSPPIRNAVVGSAAVEIYRTRPQGVRPT